MIDCFALSCVLLIGCAKERSGDGADRETRKKTAAAKSGPKRPVCAQRVLLKVRLAPADGLTQTKNFELKKTLAWIGAPSKDVKAGARRVHVAYANYEMRLGADTIVGPKKPGQMAVLVTIKSADPGKGSTPKTATVPTGAFPFGFNSPGQSYSIQVWLGGSSEPTVLSGQQPRGKAILTHSSGRYVCGSFGFRSGSGSFLRGEFNLPITGTPGKGG